MKMVPEARAMRCVTAFDLYPPCGPGRGYQNAWSSLRFVICHGSQERIRGEHYNGGMKNRDASLAPSYWRHSVLQHMPKNLPTLETPVVKICRLLWNANWAKKLRRQWRPIDCTDMFMFSHSNTRQTPLEAHISSYRGEANFDFNFFAVRDPRINAFALPGGFIGVHSELILSAQNESQLASVLAHEIGHVAQRHIARMIGNQKKMP